MASLIGIGDSYCRAPGRRGYIDPHLSRAHAVRADFGHIVCQRQGGQACTAAESRSADTGHGGRDVDTCQIHAVVESLCRDCRQSLAQGRRFQRGAAPKDAFAHTLHRSHGHGLHRGIAAEGIFIDRVYVSRDHHIFGAARVGPQRHNVIAAVVLQGHIGPDDKIDLELIPVSIADRSRGAAGRRGYIDPQGTFGIAEALVGADGSKAVCHGQRLQGGAGKGRITVYGSDIGGQGCRRGRTCILSQVEHVTIIADAPGGVAADIKVRRVGYSPGRGAVIVRYMDLHVIASCERSRRNASHGVLHGRVAQRGTVPEGPVSDADFGRGREDRVFIA